MRTPASRRGTLRHDSVNGHRAVIPTLSRSVALADDGTAGLLALTTQVLDEEAPEP